MKAKYAVHCLLLPMLLLLASGASPRPATTRSDAEAEARAKFFAENREVFEVMSLRLEAERSHIDIYLNADDVRARKPSLAHVRISGIRKVPGATFIEVLPQSGKPVLVSLDSIVAFHITYLPTPK